MGFQHSNFETRVRKVAKKSALTLVRLVITNKV
jgi:hypothetical protein